jgi:hypothetical protein
LVDVLKELQGKDLLVTSTFKASRAFVVDSFDDQGLNYFIELAEGGVLYLGGQYLDQYMPMPEINEPRKFPSTEFTIRRHRIEGWVLDIQSQGKVFEPEKSFPAFAEADFDLVPNDGEVIRDRSYDDLKTHFKKRKIKRL